MDTNFLALAERPVELRRSSCFRTVTFAAYTADHMGTIRRIMHRHGVRALRQRLEHHGLEIDFRTDEDAALIRLAIPPLRDATVSD